ncbi:MAG: DMT family transporter [Pseudomonadota bacterium]
MALAAAPATSDRDAARGMALMCCAMLVIPAVDALAKYMSQSLPPFQIAFLRYAVQTVLLAVWLKMIRRDIVLDNAARAVLRTLFVIGALMAFAVSCLFWGLKVLPLANAIALFFVAPLILTMFSKWFLGERVGWHRTTAVLVGFLGALVVVRPNYVEFGWYAVLPLLAALGFAMVVTIMRKISSAIDPLRLQTITGGSASVFLGIAVLLGSTTGSDIVAWEGPSATQWLLFLVLGSAATLAQMLMTRAIKLAEASLLAPFHYIEIVGATLFGYLVFSEFPDAMTWFGTGIILAAGLYVIHRERVLAKRRRALFVKP